MTSTPTSMPTSMPLAKSQTPAALVSRRRRCITLLEVLIVLALLAGLAALTLPSVLDRLDERAFEAAADTASEQLMMARAHAQATGEPVEVTYSPATGTVQARVYAPWSSEIDVDSGSIEPGTSPLLDPSSGSRRANSARPSTASSSSGSSLAHVSLPAGSSLAGSGDSDDAVWLSDSIDPSDRAIAEPWASRALGSGINIARRPTTFPFAPAEANADTGNARSSMFAGAADADGETLADLERGQEVRLAVFMPDGSALVGDDVFLNDQSGRCGRLSVNPWSGLPMFVRLADLAARSAAQSDGAGEGDDARNASGANNRTSPHADSEADADAAVAADGDLSSADDDLGSDRKSPRRGRGFENGD